MPAKKRWHTVAGRGAVLFATTTVTSLVAAELAARLVYHRQARRREAREPLARELHAAMQPAPPKSAEAAA